MAILLGAFLIAGLIEIGNQTKASRGERERRTPTEVPDPHGVQIQCAVLHHLELLDPLEGLLNGEGPDGGGTFETDEASRRSAHGPRALREGRTSKAHQDEVYHLLKTGVIIARPETVSNLPRWDET